MMKQPPISIFTNDTTGLATLRNSVVRAKRISLFLDYDGTLTPIRSRPSAAVLSPAAERILKQICAHPTIDTCIVTGRSMESIRRLLPLKSITIAANHGLHMRFKDGSEWIHKNALHSIRVLQLVRTALRTKLLPYPHAVVEDKQFTLSVHYRNCAPKDIPAILHSIISTTRGIDPLLRITRGKKVLEVRPKTLWGKRNAVKYYLRKTQSTVRPLAIFIGDDTTDEEAFQLVRTTGITIHVGNTSKTAAEFVVGRVRDVHRFLRLLLTLRSSTAV